MPIFSFGGKSSVDRGSRNTPRLSAGRKDYMVDLLDKVGTPEDYTRAGIARPIPRMRAATTSDKVRDWMYSLQDNPAVQALGMMPAGGGNAAATVWHGTGAPKFNKFRSSKIGTGEGAQAYGMGHYLAGNPRVAAEYYDTLKQSRPAQLAYRGVPIGEAGGATIDWTTGLPTPNPKIGRMDRAGRELFHELEYIHNTNPGMSAEQAVAVARKRLADSIRSLKGGIKRDQTTAWVHGTPDFFGVKNPKYDEDFFKHNQEQLGWKLRELDNFRQQGQYTKKALPNLSVLPEVQQGGILKVDLPDDAIEQMIKWDAPYSAQSDDIKDFVERVHPKVTQALSEGKPERWYGYSSATPMSYAKSLSGIRGGDYPTGRDLYNGIERVYGSSSGLNYQDTQHLVNAKIPGIKYLSGVARNRQHWTSPDVEDFNFVSFSDELPKVLDYYDWNKLKQGGFDWYNPSRY